MLPEHRLEETKDDIEALYEQIGKNIRDPNK